MEIVLVHPLTRAVLSAAEERGFTDTSLARHGGFSPGTIGHWRKGFDPSLRCLEAAATAIGAKIRARQVSPISDKVAFTAAPKYQANEKAHWIVHFAIAHAAINNRESRSLLAASSITKRKFDKWCGGDVDPSLSGATRLLRSLGFELELNIGPRPARRETISLNAATGRTGVRKKELRRAIESGRLKGSISPNGCGGQVEAASLRGFMRGLPVRSAESAERQSKITIPELCHPFAKFVFSEMKRQAVTYDQLQVRSGVLRSTFKAWRTNNQPGLDTIEATLAALGFRLEIVPIGQAETRTTGRPGPHAPRPHGATGVRAEA